MRRKSDSNCFIGHKFDDPVGHEENCPCTNADYEWYEISHILKIANHIYPSI